jgi:ABC-type Co2+ transport system permease subunit
VIVQAPLYLAGWVTALGIVKIVMGWPLFLAAAYFTYRLLAPILEAKRAAKALEVPEQPL